MLLLLAVARRRSRRPAGVGRVPPTRVGLDLPESRAHPGQALDGSRGGHGRAVVVDLLDVDGLEAAGRAVVGLLRPAVADRAAAAAAAAEQRPMHGSGKKSGHLFFETSLPLSSTRWFDQHIQAFPHSKKCR